MDSNYPILQHFYLKGDALVELKLTVELILSIDICNFRQ